MAADDRVKYRHTCQALTLLLGSCCCFGALAATGADMDCKNSGSRLQNLSVALDGFAVQPFERIGRPATGVAPKNAAATGAASRAAAPILYLAPQIAAVLSDVFNDAAVDIGLQSEVNVSDARSGHRGSPASGVPKIIGPPDAVVPDDEVVHFQRRMYRKDI